MYVRQSVSMGQGQFSYVACQDVSLGSVSADDGMAHVVGAERLHGNLLDDLLELRGGDLDLVHLGGQGLVLHDGGGVVGDGIGDLGDVVHGGEVGVVHGGSGGDGDGVALLPARHVEALVVLAEGLDELGLLELDLDVVGLGHVLGHLRLVLVGLLLDGGGDGGDDLVGVVDDRGVVLVRHGVVVGEGRGGVGQHRLHHLHLLGADGGERHGTPTGTSCWTCSGSASSVFGPATNWSNGPH